MYDDAFLQFNYFDLRFFIYLFFFIEVVIVLIYQIPMCTDIDRTKSANSTNLSNNIINDNDKICK